MFVFIVRAASFDYDEYDSATVIAESGVDAISMCISDDSDCPIFSADQAPFSAELICGCDATEAQMLTASFNAG